jgi:alanine racemase
MRDCRVWAEISLNTLKENVVRFRDQLPHGVRILGVVKADAYGHGAVPIAWSLLESGAAMLGVGDSNEAIQLRESGITGPILILGAIIEEEIMKVVQYRIATSVHSLDILEQLGGAAERYGHQHPIHIKVDTGMSRLGASPSHAMDIARAVRDDERLTLEGVSTHFASASDLNYEFTAKQNQQFREFLLALREEGIEPQYTHAANSVAAMGMEDIHYTMVRPGIALFGIDPGAFSKIDRTFNPILSLKTRIAYLKTVSKGTPIGYGGTYTTKKKSRIATIPIGYNDGYPYRLSNQAEVLIRGKRAPIVGTVTMDYVMVDVTKIPDVHVGDDVTLIGTDGDEQIRVEDLAKIVETIPYEITCALGKRVRRVYV